ncbi:hypothetical protein WH95_02515 [Kiloniella litopenaei]|uniref:Uncharacterized protein n=1 Tax=Kiloniella litopenaei TaxID=1549748 RepID=A0A0M2R8L9_9PROT|nr:hypothetical protein WH95_02515 [Kiloniella litopenaei]
MPKSGSATDLNTSYAFGVNSPDLLIRNYKLYPVLTEISCVPDKTGQRDLLVCCFKGFCFFHN